MAAGLCLLLSVHWATIFSTAHWGSDFLHLGSRKKGRRIHSRLKSVPHISQFISPRRTPFSHDFTELSVNGWMRDRDFHHNDQIPFEVNIYVSRKLTTLREKVERRKCQLWFNSRNPDSPPAKPEIPPRHFKTGWKCKFTKDKVNKFSKKMWIDISFGVASLTSFGRWLVGWPTTLNFAFSFTQATWIPMLFTNPNSIYKLYLQDWGLPRVN